MRSMPAKRPQGLARSATRANRALSDLTSRYYSAIPLDRIFDAVESAGFAFDPEEQQCILCGREGRATWQLFSPDTKRQVNHMLVLNWYKMDVTGRYEIVAYVS